MRSRRFVLLLSVLVTAAAAAAGVARAPYIETIPTATGGKPVGESTPSVHTGGSSSGVDSVGAVGGSSGAARRAHRRRQGRGER